MAEPEQRRVNRGIAGRDPRRFGILTFGSLMLFIVFTALTEYFPYYIELGNYKLYYLFLVALRMTT